MYFIKNDDVILISNTESVNFDPHASTAYAAEYMAWLQEGNHPKQWQEEDE